MPSDASTRSSPEYQLIRGGGLPEILYWFKVYLLMKIHKRQKKFKSIVEVLYANAISLNRYTEDMIFTTTLAGFLATNFKIKKKKCGQVRVGLHKNVCSMGVPL